MQTSDEEENNPTDIDSYPPDTEPEELYLSEEDNDTAKIENTTIGAHSVDNFDVIVAAGDEDPTLPPPFLSGEWLKETLGNLSAAAGEKLEQSGDAFDAVLLQGDAIVDRSHVLLDLVAENLPSTAAEAKSMFFSFGERLKAKVYPPAPLLEMVKTNVSPAADDTDQSRKSVIGLLP